MTKLFYRLLFLFAFQIISFNTNAQSLKTEFSNPPESARPWVYWFWSNGNLSKKGITADLEAMKRVGIGGVLIFEVDKGVPIGPYDFGGEKWRELFKFMVQEADRLGLKVNMNNSAGWTGSGGPWMPVEKSMQKIVWTETVVQGSKKLETKLQQPEAVNGYYEDLMTLAFPTPEGDDMRMSQYQPEIKISSDNVKVEGKKLIDRDEKSHIELTKPTPKQPYSIDIVFEKPFTSRFLTIRVLRDRWTMSGTLQVSSDGENYKTIKEIHGEAPTISTEFNEQTARWYRILLKDVPESERPMDKISISEVDLSNTRLNGIEQKAMFVSHPNLKKDSNIIEISTEFQPLQAKYAVPANQVLNISEKMNSDGTLSWDKPEGKWTIFRIGHTTTGRINFTGPKSGVGYECDKLSKDASTTFFNGFIAKLAKESKDLAGDAFVPTHIDSWEIGSQNWTPGFFQEFKKRRGYDPLPYIPAIMGIIINNTETTERFLWDFRKTISDLMLENYVGNISDLAHQNGLKLSVEAYNKSLTNELTYAGRADEPMGEFWAWNKKYEFDFSCTEMASAAHVYGKKIVGAEAFTSGRDEAWLSHPGSIKELGDWALCAGINRFVFHRYAMQPYLNISPGVSMGPFGMHYERTQTWWEQSIAWHQYLARCQYLLQQGLFVADLCYVSPELTPLTWKSPYKRDDATYKFDGCPAEVVLTRMSVKDGLIVLPDGMNYKVLVMPETEIMTPQLLKKFKELAEAGATVIGTPPKKALGLSNYPQNDLEVQKIAAELWGNCDGVNIKENKIGKGRIIYGKIPEEVLAEMEIEKDFSSEEYLRFIHRNIDGTQVYFIANPEKKPVTTICTFRVKGMQPQLWDPMTGKTEKAGQFEEVNGMIKMPISLEAEGSVFIVFESENKSSESIKKLSLNGEETITNIAQNDKNEYELTLSKPGEYSVTRSDERKYSFEVEKIPEPLELKGSWDVYFIDGMGAPEKTIFPELISWPKHPNENIKYYSGHAIYKKNISLSKEMMENNKLLLDLGNVAIMAEVKINGKDLGILWKRPYTIDITNAVKMGTNTIEIKVVNLWINRLIGDEQLPEDSNRKANGSLHEWPQWVLEGKTSPTNRNSFTTWQLWEKDSPLLESGLLGPVRLFFEKQVTLDDNSVSIKK